MSSIESLQHRELELSGQIRSLAGRLDVLLDLEARSSPAAAKVVRQERSRVARDLERAEDAIRHVRAELAQVVSAQRSAIAAESSRGRIVHAAPK